MAVTFKFEPRHAQMFGSRQGILAPLYQRQAAQTALAENERDRQARFEQAKSLIGLRTRLQEQLQGPLRRAQIGEIEARTGQREFELGEAQELSTLKDETIQALQQPGLTEAERGQIWNRYMIGIGRAPTQERQFAPQRPTFLFDPSGQPVRDESGQPVAVPGGIKFTPAAADEEPSNIPITRKDFAFEEDQTRQLIGGFGQEKLSSRVLKKLGVKQAGTIDNYIGKFMGGEWNQAKMDEFAKIFAYISDPANANVVAKDKQIQTLATALRRLQRSYDPVLRDQILRPQDAAPEAFPDAGGDTGFGQFMQGQGEAAAFETQLADSIQERAQKQHQWQGIFSPPFR